MRVVLFTVAGSPPIVASVLNEDDEKAYLTVEYPVVFMKDDPHVYTMPYMPFAKEGIVLVNRANILTLSSVYGEMEDYYKTVVKELREQKITFSTSTESEKTPVVSKIKQKTLH
jgi:hypothetical protein